MECPMTEYESLLGFCKYMSDSKTVMEGVFLNNKILFTQPAALNDPLDCNPVLKIPSNGDEQSMYSFAGITMPSLNLWFHVQLVESHINEYGILSLTKNPVSSDMWSMYANGHRGFLIEFAADFPDNRSFQSKEGSSYSVRKVDYVDKFLINIETCLDKDGRLEIEKFRNLLFYQKAKRWAKEKEFRMVRPLADLGKEAGGVHVGIERDHETPYLCDLPFSTIKSITFGATMPREKKLWIIEKCSNSKIQFLQCLVYPLKMDDAGLTPHIDLLPLDDPKTMKMVLDMNPQLLLMAGEELLGHEQIAVSHLSELPYYEGYEQLVDLMYEKRKAKHLKG
jgi:hypothetical protein